MCKLYIQVLIAFKKKKLRTKLLFLLWAKQKRFFFFKNLKQREFVHLRSWWAWFPLVVFVDFHCVLFCCFCFLWFVFVTRVMVSPPVPRLLWYTLLDLSNRWKARFGLTNGACFHFTPCRSFIRMLRYGCVPTYLD